MYKTTITLLYPLIWLYLKRRMSKGKEDKLRFSERLGKSDISRPQGFLVWLHGASVGEINSLESVIKTLKKDYPKINILLTSGTTTSAPIAKKKYPEIIHQYIPIDVPFCVNRFMKHWHPDLAIRVDSDFWPLQLDSLKRNKIPNILLNGAVSDKTYKTYMEHKTFTKKMLDSFSDILAKSEKDAEHLRNMGAKNVVVCDNIKFTNPAPVADESELKIMKEIFKNKPIWHSAVLGEGEEEIVLQAHKKVLEKFPNSILIITPRHTNMGENLFKKAKELGLNPIQRSKTKTPNKNTNVYIADTMGEMGLFYKLSQISFMGRSLLPECRGSSPLEAAKSDSLIIAGPYTSTFDELYSEMESAGIIDPARDSTEIAKQVNNYLSDSKKLSNRIKATENFIKTKDKTLEKIMNTIKKYIKK